MVFMVFLLCLAATHAVPTGGITSPAPVNADEKKENLPELPYAVKRFNFVLPAKPYYEERFSNDGIYFVRFPQYTVNVHYRCPFEFVATEFLVNRMTDKTKCLTVADLTYWSKVIKKFPHHENCIEARLSSENTRVTMVGFFQQDNGKDIVLDSYKIERDELGKKNPIDSVAVYKAPEGNVHHVTLAMADRTCRMMTYTVTPVLKVETQHTVVDCNIVDKLEKDNSEWVSKQKHAAKLAAATKLLAEAKEKEEKAAKEKEAKEKAEAALEESFVKPAVTSAKQ